MKFRLLGLVLILAGAIITTQTFAQEVKEKLVVPLSKPGQKGSLEVGLIKGSITVEGYNGKEVIVLATTKNNKNKCNNSEKSKNDGLKRINGSSFSLDIEEKNNHVEISSDHFNKKIDLEIMVPKNFSLNIGTVNNGHINISNVEGNHEVSNVNGSIKMVAISGSVVANTVNGKLEIQFDKVSPNTPMVFSNFNKNIDITLPPQTKATLKMDAKMGDILTDFDAEMVKSGPDVEKSNKSGVYKVSVSQTVTAKINGGGPEFKFKNFNGDIIIRKGK